jgi:hypothetical protein
MTKTQTTKTASNHANISTWIDSLTTKRETWENGTYKASNEELYVLLDECVDLFKEVRAHRSLVKKLNLILEERDIMMRSNTSLATKIVRLIFGDCGKRAYTYARVLIVAAEQKGELQSMKSFVAEAGGIEEIRKSQNGQTPTQKRNEQIAFAVEVLETRLGLIQTFKISEELAPHNESAYELSVAIVRKERNGKGSIVFGTNNQTILKAALAQAGKSLSKIVEEAKQASGRKQMLEERKTVIAEKEAA